MVPGVAAPRRRRGDMDAPAASPAAGGEQPGATVRKPAALRRRAAALETHLPARLRAQWRSRPADAGSACGSVRAAASLLVVARTPDRPFVLRHGGSVGPSKQQ